MKTTKKTPLKLEGISENLYAGFWKRLGSLLLDGLIVLPFTGLMLFINNIEYHYYYFTMIPTLIFTYWYFVYLVQLNGGTPGKIIVGIKIVKSDGEKVTLKEALLRHSVSLGFSVLAIIIHIISLQSINTEPSNYDVLIHDNSFTGKILNVQSQQPELWRIYTWASNIWIYSELVILLFNKRKRALHDFIGNTVVINKKYEKELRENAV